MFQQETGRFRTRCYRVLNIGYRGSTRSDRVLRTVLGAEAYILGDIVEAVGPQPWHMNGPGTYMPGVEVYEGTLSVKSDSPGGKARRGVSSRLHNLTNVDISMVGYSVLIRLST